jgi:drug/metabolite transporter (DMT)-like permease
MLAPRHWYGFWLSVLTAFMWGILPVAFVLLLDSLDVLSITWARFAFSTLLVFWYLRQRGQVPRLTGFDRRGRLLLLVAILALLGNFLLYLKGLEYLNPEATVILIQLAPFLLMAGSVLIHGERFGLYEAVGAVLLLLGLGLYFNEKLGVLLQASGSETLGVVFMVLAALSWSVYGLLQKGLLRSMGSVQLTLLIYGGGTLALLLFISPAAFAALGALQWWVLLFCCLNMLIGYGAFTEALRVWEGAKVSAVIALAPVFTIIGMQAAVSLWPAHFSSSNLNPLAYAGALVVVAGSMLAALGRGRKR